MTWVGTGSSVGNGEDSASFLSLALTIGVPSISFPKSLLPTLLPIFPVVIGTMPANPFLAGVTGKGKEAGGIGIDPDPDASAFVFVFGLMMALERVVRRLSREVFLMRGVEGAIVEMQQDDVRRMIDTRETGSWKGEGVRGCTKG